MKFAVSIAAVRVQGNINNFVHHPFMVVAVSKSEAIGTSLQILDKLYPSRDGWQNMGVIVCEDNNIVTVETAQLTK